MCFFKREIDISVEQEPQNTITLEADGGVSDYNLLSNKPKINGVTVENERDGNDYGLVNKSELGDYVKKNESPTLNAGDEYVFNFATGSQRAKLELTELLGFEMNYLSTGAQINLRRWGDVQVQAPSGATIAMQQNDGASIELRNGIYATSASGREIEIKQQYGSAIKVKNNGDISLEPSAGKIVFADGNPVITTKDKATTSALGVVKVDGETINANDGVISVTPEGWQKPADWIDISSGAINNSIYLLVGHPANYSTLNNLGFVVALNDNTHNFNVYIDNAFYQTYQSGSAVAISWSDLALTTGKNTTFPIDLTTHIVRITPENNSDTIYSFQQVRANASSGQQRQGVLWAHFAVDYALNRVRFAVYNNCFNYYLVAVTALGDNLHISGNTIEQLFGDTYDKVNEKSHYLSYIPTIEVDTLESWGGAFNNAGPLNKVRLKVNTKMQQGASENSQYAFVGNMKKVEINKPIILSSRKNVAVRLFAMSKMEKLPAFDATDMVHGADFLTNNTNLKDTILDFSNAKNLEILTLYGAANTRMDGLKGVFVSNQAPFDRTTSPQLKVSYTGLDRSALVNLFKSMPTVSNSQVCDITGTTGAADLTAEDLAIATNKGWTVTR